MIKPLKWDEDTTPTKHANSIHTKVDELIDAVNALEKDVDNQGDEVCDLMTTVYGGDDDCQDCDDDICPDCWAETEPFIANLPNLPIERLIALQDRVADLLDQRLDDDEDGEVHIEDAHFYHPDGKEITDEEVLAFQNEPRGSSKQPSGETYFVTTDDGLLFDLVKMCITHPELRLWQAAASVSGYKLLFGSNADDPTDYSNLKDLFHK